MAKGRMLNKVMLTSQKVNKISEGAENLYFRILLLVDDYGRYYADPDIIKSYCYPKRKVSISIIKIRLIELTSIRLVKTYKDNDEEYLEFVNFQKYQSFRSDIKLKEEFPSPKTFLQGSRNEPVTGCIESERTVEVTSSQQSINRSINNNSNKDKNKNLRHKVINYLNEKTNKSFGLDSKDSIQYINGRIDKNKATFEQFKYVIDIKKEQWLDDDEYNKYLRPSTLFRESNFENYLNEKLKQDEETWPEWSERKEKEKKEETE